MFDQDMIFRIPALLIALTVHEYAHARAAVALGDPTPRYEGRLTLNPVAHLDPLGLLMLWLVQFGWAKPVMVNPRNFRNWRKDMTLVSIAGPGANVATAFITAVLMVVLGKAGVLSGNMWLSGILQLTYVYNIILAVFNMIPIPPLDGSKVLMNFLPGDLAYKFESLERFGPFLLIFLVYIGVIGMIARPFQQALSYLIYSVIRLFA